MAIYRAKINTGFYSIYDFSAKEKDESNNFVAGGIIK
jgi:hypothetical protein